MLRLTIDSGTRELREHGKESETPNQNNPTYHEAVYSSVSTALEADMPF